MRVLGHSSDRDVGSTRGTPQENPYLSARRTWNDHVGRLVADRTLWQIVGLLALLLAIASVGGLIHLAGRSRFVPYVVEVDQVGRTYAVSRADRLAPADKRVIEAQLADFVTMARRVTPDVALQRQAIFRVYSMLNQGDPATAKMNAYLNGTEEQNPFNRARQETVVTEVRSILQQSEESWQVEWTETMYDRKGKQKEAPANMRAVMTVYQAPLGQKTSEETLRDNPLGIFIRDFDWVRQRAVEELP